MARGSATERDLDRRLIYQYARALYLDRGGDPRVLDEIPWRDVEAWLSIHDVLDARRAFGGVPDG